MACFDEVICRCPKCGAKMVFQTKAMLSPGAHYDEDAYEAHDVPLAIAADLDNSAMGCTCGAFVELHPTVSRVAMLVQIQKGDD